MAPKAKSTALANIPMVASHGHDSHPRVQLEPTRDGMRAFLIKFKAILSQDLSDALDLYLDNPKAPKTTEAKTTHKAIWRALVPCLNGLDHLLLKIYRDCRQDDGPHAIFWLIKELDNKTPVSSVKSVIDLLKTTTFDGDIVSGIDGIISTNDRLDEPFQFSDAITSILILVHLPQQLSTLRNLIIHEMSDDSVPPPAGYPQSGQAGALPPRPRLFELRDRQHDLRHVPAQLPQVLQLRGYRRSRNLGVSYAARQLHRVRHRRRASLQVLLRQEQQPAPIVVERRTQERHEAEASGIRSALARHGQHREPLRRSRRNGHCRVLGSY